MDPLSGACRDVFGRALRARQPLHGGDLSEVTLVELDDGQRVVAKEGPLVAREARMLAALAAADAPVPRVLGLSGPVLFLEALTEGRAGPAAWARFGADLARLHGTLGAGYGWHEDYAFGPVAIGNGGAENWPDFWADRRLRPFLPHLPRALALRVERLADRLPDQLPARPAAALLHGDLWAGNLLPASGRIKLIDPACYYGDREVDLAMLHLFGAPGDGFWQGYGALEPGWQPRRAIYALFPALVHVRLFGAGYHAMAERFLGSAGV